MARPKKRALDVAEKNLLIEEVKRRPYLYSQEEKKRSDKTSVAAWKEIAELLNASEETIRASWKNIRDTYRRYKKSTKPEDYDTIKWTYFQQCFFLDGHMQRIREDTNEDSEFEDANNQDDSNDYEPEVKIVKPAVPFIKIEKETDEVMLNLDFDKDEFDGLQECQEISTSQDDYNLMFLKSLLPFFRKLEPTRNLIVRNKIQQILLNEISRSIE